MRAEEFLSEIERFDYEQYHGGKEELPIQIGKKRQIKPVPGGSGLGYYVVDGRVIYIVDPRKPLNQRDNKNDIIVGIMLLEKNTQIGIPNVYQVEKITVDEDYRGRGVARSLYGIALTILRYTLQAGSGQTPDGRRMWQMLYSIPGVNLFGIVQDWNISPKIQRAIINRGGRVLHQARDSEGNLEKTLAFPVRRGPDELVSAIQNLDIYSDMDDNGVSLFARWTGNAS